MKPLLIPFFVTLLPGTWLIADTTPTDRAASFRQIDANRDGHLSMNELESFPQIRARLANADLNGDGLLSIEELRQQKPDPAPAPPASDKLVPGDHIRTVRVGDLDRRYLVHVPASYDPKTPAPVVLIYHGGGGNPESTVRLSGMNAKADEAGFVAVYPYGSGVNADRGLTFNGGDCCGYAMHQEIDDVAFTAALLDDLEEIASIDPSRVYATGLSNGGIMAHFVAAHLSDRIAAIAPVGGPLMTESIKPDHPVPVMHFHGTADAFAPFDGGYGQSGTGGRGATDFRSVQHSLDAWIAANGCQPESATEALPDITDDGMTVTRKIWSGGKEGSEVVLIEIQGGGHTWPGNPPTVPMLGPSTTDISANDLMWEFFQRHSRKTTPAPLPSEE